MGEQLSRRGNTTGPLVLLHRTTLEEMQGWGWQKVHHPDEIGRVLQRIRRAFATGEPWEDTFPLRCKDCEYRRPLPRAPPIRDADGHPVVAGSAPYTEVNLAESEIAPPHQRQ